MFFLSLGTVVLAQEYVISTIAGGAPPPTPVPGVNMPSSVWGSNVAVDGMGNTYFVSFNSVFQLDQNGVVTRIAGNGRPGYSGDGGLATSAQLQPESMSLHLPTSDWYVDAPPSGIAVDRGGNVYVADNGNYRVRKIAPDGIITTLAGNGTPGFSGDGGPAISAQLSQVSGLAVDLTGNLLIADSGANRIRRVAADGSIATVAGTGDCGFTGDGGPAAVAQVCVPTGIATDSTGNLFIADTVNNRIRQVRPDGSITTAAATGTATSVAVDQAGNLYVNDAETDGWNIWQVVKKISPSGTITIVAGFPCNQVNMQPLCSADQTNATTTFFDGSLGLAVDNTGNLLVADGRIRRVSPNGAIVTLAGSCGGLPMFNPPDCQRPFIGDGGPATSAILGAPGGVAVDGAGNLFVADYVNDRIRKVSPDGIISTIAGNGTYFAAGDGGPATSAQMSPGGLAVDGSGNIFLFDGSNRSIRKISVDGIIATVISVGGGSSLALDAASDLFIPDPTNPSYAVAEVSPRGTIRRVAGGANTGCDTDNGCSGFLGDGGPATSAQLNNPGGLAVDAAGNIFIADSQDHRIRKVTPDGIITTVAGSSSFVAGNSPGAQGFFQGGFSGDGGPAVNAQLYFPSDITVDGTGNLYIADYDNQRIRRVSPDGIISTIAGNGTPGYSGDGGPATSASLWWPSALAVDGAGNIYVADSGNNAVRVLRPVQ
jgi:sugar lactone lactonase YvrE